jgi:hypothetical protein
MTTERTRTVVILGAVILVVVLVLGGLAWLGLALHAQTVQRRELAQLKAVNPVEYYVLHTAKTQSDEALKNEMTGTWELRGVMNRQTGQFLFVPAHSGYFKTWTPTNWAIVTYDTDSNVLYSASGHYSLQGDLYTESIEAATGQMTRYRGAHPKFKIRLDGDNYYQMSAGKNASPLEEMWQRVE